MGDREFSGWAEGVCVPSAGDGHEDASVGGEQVGGGLVCRMWDTSASRRGFESVDGLVPALVMKAQERDVLVREEIEMFERFEQTERGRLMGAQ